MGPIIGMALAAGLLCRLRGLADRLGRDAAGNRAAASETVRLVVVGCVKRTTHL